jgi:hypothetical protein
MANKRVKATDVEEFYIKANPDNLTEQQLAKKFDLSLKTVKSIIDDTKTEIVSSTEIIAQDIKPKKEETITRQMFIRKADSGKKGITILTKAASERIDENAKESRAKAKKNRYNNDYTTTSFDE